MKECCMNKKEVEEKIRSLCWQDKQMNAMHWTEEEIQECLNDKYPFTHRIILGLRKKQDINQK